MNMSRNFLNDSAHNSILYFEGNVAGIIATPIIESTFENDYIHVLNDIPKQYIYE